MLCTHADCRGQNKVTRRPVGGVTATLRPAPPRAGPLLLSIKVTRRPVCGATATLRPAPPRAGPLLLSIKVTRRPVGGATAPPRAASRRSTAPVNRAAVISTGGYFHWHSSRTMSYLFYGRTLYIICSRSCTSFHYIRIRQETLQCLHRRLARQIEAKSRSCLVSPTMLNKTLPRIPSGAISTN